MAKRMKDFDLTVATMIRAAMLALFLATTAANAQEQPSDTPVAETQVQEDAILSDLMSAVAGWIADTAQKMPEAALGAPVNVRIEQAGDQIKRRLENPANLEGARSFLEKALPGWVGIVLVLLLAKWVLRRLIPERPLSRIMGFAFARDVAMRFVRYILPSVTAVVLLVIYSLGAGFNRMQGELIGLIASPFLVANMAIAVFFTVLSALEPTRGRRLTGYAARRMSKWVTMVVGLSIASSAVSAPAARSAMGWATSELTSLVLDLVTYIVAAYAVSIHRRTVRRLIVRREPGGTHVEGSALSSSVLSVANHWHLFAYAFLTLNVFARLFGSGDRSFVTPAIISVLLVTVALVASSMIDRFFAGYIARSERRWNRGTRDIILAKVSIVLAMALRYGLLLGTAAICLTLWGFDIWAWVRSEPGTAIIGPLVASAIALFTAWVAWVALDVWIERTLTTTDAFGQQRPRSSRLKTILPLIRNFAFVLLTVLTAIGVLSNLGVNVAPLLAGAGVVGLAIGFGSQQLVQDVITGLFIILEDTLAIGDNIDTGDRAGTVEALTIRTVKIRDGDGALHSIPFSSIKALKNSSRDFGVYTVSVTVDPKADAARAIEILKEVGKEVCDDPQFASKIMIPFEVWGVDQITPDGIVIKGAVRTRPLQQWSVGRTINLLAKARFDAEGIQLASRNTLMMMQGAATA